MEEWRQLNLLETNKNATNNFIAAVEILINKPHVINKRLCGRNILYRKDFDQTLNRSEISGFLKQCRECWGQLSVKEGNRDIESFIKKCSEAIVKERSAGIEASPAKKIKCLSGEKRYT